MTEPQSAPFQQPPRSAASAGLTPQEQQALVDAARLLKPLARAARVANFDGTLYTIGGALSLLAGGLGMDVVNLTLGVALLAVGLFERGAARQLRVAHPQAPLRVAKSELAGLAVMCSYFLYAWLVMPALSEEFSSQLSGLGSLGDSARRDAEAFQRIIYPTLLVTSLVVQGLVVRYFLSKRAAVNRYLDEVPEWARKVAEGVSD